MASLALRRPLEKTEKKIVLVSILGNTLEYYDFTLFSFLSPILAPLFFPTADRHLSLILTLGTYAVSFFMRPLGAIFFGYIGDCYGRKTAFSLCVMMMAIPTTFMGLLSTYQDIGLASPIILIILRLLQGFCIGGGYNGSALYVVENVAVNRRGLFGSFITVSSALGTLLASLVSSFVVMPFMPSYGWRLAFLLGGLMGFLGFYYMRQRLPEPPVQKRPQNTTPLMDSFRLYPKTILYCIGIAGFSGTMYSLSFQYMSIFLALHNHWILSEALLLMSMAITTYIIAVPLFGYLGDLYGYKRVSVLGAGATLGGLLPLFYSLIETTSFLLLMAIQVVLGLLAACFQAPLNAHFATLYPPHIRYSSVAFSYNLGIALFGGTMPVIATALIQGTHSLMMPAFYTLLWAFLGGLSMYLTKPYIEPPK